MWGCQKTKEILKGWRWRKHFRKMLKVSEGKMKHYEKPHFPVTSQRAFLEIGGASCYRVHIRVQRNLRAGNYTPPADVDLHFLWAVI